MPKAVRMRSDMSAFAAAIEKSNGQDVQVVLVTSCAWFFGQEFSTLSIHGWTSIFARF